MPPPQVLPSPSSGSHVPSPSHPLTLPLLFLSLNCGLIQRAIMHELSVCALKKKCFAPLNANTRANRGDKKFSTKMAKNKEDTTQKEPYR